MQQTRVIGFIPPVEGIDGEFNTFRLGLFYSKHLSPGEEVFLLDEKAKMVIGKARVESVEAGPLGEMCLIHGDRNHTELHQSKDGQSAARLFALLRKINGPHIATVQKKTSVVYLKRLE